MHELAYANETPIKFRKELGQFFTPTKVAELMVSWVIQDNPESILDPAFGLGVFFDVLAVNGSMHGCRAVYSGFEIDENIISYLANSGEETPQIEVSDYLEATPQSYDAIVCNPPYMRFQNFLNRHNVLPIIEKNLGFKIAGYSNISSVFLMKSLSELNQGGRLAYIMPFEFFNTGYGRTVKRELLKNGLLKQILFFKNEKDIFPDATTTVCILLCKNDGVLESIKVSRVESLAELNSINNLDDYYQHELRREDVPCNKKWTQIISSLYQEFIIPDGLSKIRDYGKFVRGIATGANEFFALKQQKITELGIDPVNIRKCITKSQQIRKPIFVDDDFETLLENGAPVYCLDVHEHFNNEVISYLSLGISKGFHDRYLTKNRKPWYKLESRLPAPILAGVFNRGRLKIIRNFTDAINFTCFHSFYPDMFGGHYVNRIFVYLFSETGQSIVMMNKRKYGAELDKFEPGDLNECYCPSTTQFNKASEAEAIKIIEVAMTDEKEAMILSNNLVAKMLDI